MPLMSKSGSRPHSSKAGRRAGQGVSGTHIADWFRIARGERWLVGAAGLQIVGLWFAGGGVTGIGATALISVLTMILLFVGILNNIPQTFATARPSVRIVLVGVVVLPLLQLVPLPPTVWQHLPGQDLRLEAYTLIGIADTWQPLSLTPADTVYTAIMAIAFVTLTLVLMTVSREAQIVLLRMILVTIGIGLLVGVAQVASGGGALRVRDRADHGALIGFFSNKNHMALMLATSLPMVALLSGAYDRQRNRTPWIFIGYWVLCIFAVLMTNSRAGVMLSLLATVLIGIRMLRDQPRRYLIGGSILVLGLAAFVTTLPQVDALFDRFNSVGDDLRWRFAWQSVPLLHEYWLTGSGSGSFSRLYAVHEKLAWVKPTLVNHLHDDFYQVAIEQGLAGVLLLLLTTFSLISSSARAWLSDPARRNAIFCSGTIVLLFALHSIVDYPLRRPATFPVLAIAFAMLWWRARDGLGSRASDVIESKA
jgi:hypothetical protein